VCPRRHPVRISDAFGDETADAIRRCRAIKARADENDEERGLRTLSVAWEMATWTNSVSTYTPQAPVLLCRANLVPRGGAADDFDLQLDEAEWEINPVLLHVLASNFDVRIDAETLLDLLGDETELPDGGAVFDRLIKECGDVDGFECSSYAAGFTMALALGEYFASRDLRGSARLKSSRSGTL